jgi:hypothetical protein
MRNTPRRTQRHIAISASVEHKRPEDEAVTFIHTPLTAVTGQVSPRILQQPQVYYWVQNSQPLVPIHNHINPLNVL